MGPTECISNAMRITHRGCRHLLSPNLPELMRHVIRWDISAASFEEDTDTSCWIVANALFEYGVVSGNP